MAKKQWISRSLDHNGRERKGRAREYVKRMVGDRGFTRNGDLKKSAIRRAKAIARRNGDVSMEDSLDEALTLKRLGGIRLRHRR